MVSTFIPDNPLKKDVDTLSRVFDWLISEGREKEAGEVEHVRQSLFGGMVAYRQVEKVQKLVAEYERSL